MVSKLLKGRGLWLQVSCKSFPTVSQLRRFVDPGKLTYNSYMYLCKLLARATCTYEGYPSKTVDHLLDVNPFTSLFISLVLEPPHE